MSEQESAVIAVLDKVTDEQWRAIMTWAAPKMAEENQQFLAELLCREASRRLEKWKPLEGRTVSDFFRTVVDEIGLKIVPA